MKELLLFITYPKTLELFGRYNDFENNEEQKLLNRHWIMLGKSEKNYLKLDCVKILRMSYGTIRLGKLGIKDTL